MKYVGALTLVIVLSISWHLLGDATIQSRGYLIIAGYITACLLVLPLEIGLFAAGLFVCVFLGLEKINDTKVALTRMPLTFMDIKIAFQNPEGLISAIKVERWVLFLAYFVCAGVGMAVIILAIRRVRKLLTTGLPVTGTSAGAVIFLVSAFMLWQFTLTLNSRVEASVDNRDLVWRPEGAAVLSRQIGLLSFILYSYGIERGDPTQSFSSVSSIAPPSATEISEAVSSYVRPKENELAPNIVLVLAESTFNPNKAFNLSTPVNGSLLSSNPDTQALGQVHVNVVGGGTWVTEFETITGVDSRFFGYSGYYTHASVSPYIKESLAGYLKGRGYRTAGFYAVQGNFYNARNAYKNYGFQNFYDSVDLGYDGADYFGFTDTGLMNAVVEKLGPNPDAPFFAYVVTIGNHGPHPCIDFSSKKEFITTLVGTEDFYLNCELNEYLLRLRSTNQAFDTILQYLRELQTKTGRPYVVLVFGDHQPPTFTNASVHDHKTFPIGYKVYDYSPYRTSASLNETIFHLVSNKPHRVACCEKAVPTWLIPSIVSTFTGANAEDVYLGINFYLYARCGPNVFPASKPNGLFGKQNYWRATQRRGAVVSPACEQAREQAFAAYRLYGIF